MKHKWISGMALVTLALQLAACAGDKRDAITDTSSTGAAGSQPATGDVTPDQGRKIIEVQMITDEQGNNRFDPSEVEAHRGDVVRFVLKMGVHNVNFLADSNSGKSGLPAVSDMLQLPGQTYDLKVSMAPGKYYFQCDPHALLGMTGRLEIEE